MQAGSRSCAHAQGCTRAVIGSTLRRKAVRKMPVSDGKSPRLVRCKSVTSSRCRASEGYPSSNGNRRAERATANFRKNPLFNDFFGPGFQHSVLS